MLRLLHANAERYTRAAAGMRVDLRESQQEHRAILDAYARRRRGGRGICRAHREATRRRHVAHLDKVGLEDGRHRRPGAAAASVGPARAETRECAGDGSAAARRSARPHPNRRVLEPVAPDDVGLRPDRLGRRARSSTRTSRKSLSRRAGRGRPPRQARTVPHVRPRLDRKPGARRETTRCGGCTRTRKS